MSVKPHYKLTSLLENLCIILLISSLLISCQQSSDISQSALIQKINAVQEQVMAQGNITAEEEQAISNLCSIFSQDDGLALHPEADRMILKDVDIAPIHMSCEKLSAEETMTCFKDQIASYIEQEFDSNISTGLHLSSPKEVEAFFIVDENGKTTGLKVREAEVEIQAEILRILRNMPNMKPAMLNDQAVAVLCSLVLSYGDKIDVKLVYIPERPED